MLLSLLFDSAQEHNATTEATSRDASDAANHSKADAANPDKGNFMFPDNFIVATDCVLFAFDGWELNVLLIERGIEPFRGRHALPGGFMRRSDQSAEHCAKRELKEETCFGKAEEGKNDRESREQIELNEVGIYSEEGRDPRGRIISIAYWGIVKAPAEGKLPEVAGCTDAARAEWVSVNELLDIKEDEKYWAFDHGQILRDAVDRLRESMLFRPVVFNMLPDEFTRRVLMRCYQAVLGRDYKLDRGNFFRKLMSNEIVKPADNGNEKPADPAECVIGSAPGSTYYEMRQTEPDDSSMEEQCPEPLGNMIQYDYRRECPEGSVNGDNHRAIFCKLWAGDAETPDPDSDATTDRASGTGNDVYDSPSVGCVEATDTDETDVQATKSRKTLYRFDRESYDRMKSDRTTFRKEF